MKKPVKDKKKKDPTVPRIERSGDLQHFELSGEDNRSPSMEASETDEDEREGSGDGKMGRSAGVDKP